MEHLLRRILRYRAAFFGELKTSATVGDVRASCSHFQHRLVCWLESLEVAVMKADGVPRRVRKVIARQVPSSPAVSLR